MTFNSKYFAIWVPIWLVSFAIGFAIVHSVIGRGDNNSITARSTIAQADTTTKLAPPTTNEVTRQATNQKPTSERNLLKEKALAEELIQQVNSSGEITDKQAETLGKAFVYSIELNKLTSISNKQVKLLSKADRIELNGLTSITKEQAEFFGSCSSLELNGLTSLNDSQAESLSKIKFLSLSGLTSITAKQAASLSKVLSLEIDGLRDEAKGIMETVNKLGTITDEQAELLSNICIANDDQELRLNGVTSLTDKQVEWLSKAESIQLNGLTSITEKQADFLDSSWWLELNGLTTLNDRQAESLSKVDNLNLDGLTSLTDEQAESLSRVGLLSVCGLTSITDQQAKILAKAEDLLISEACQPLIDKYKKQ